MSERLPTSLTIRTPQAPTRKEFLKRVVNAVRREAAIIWDKAHPKYAPTVGGRPSHRGLVCKVCDEILQKFKEWGKFPEYSQAELIEAVARHPTIKSNGIGTETILRHVKYWFQHSEHYALRPDLWPKSIKKAYPGRLLFHYELKLESDIWSKYKAPLITKFSGYPDINEWDLKPVPRELQRKVENAKKRRRRQILQKEPYLVPIYEEYGLLP